MNKLYIIDDEKFVLDCLVTTVDWKSIDACVVGCATTGTAALDEILELRPEVVITDIRMPGKDGLELIRLVREVLPRTAFIVLSGYNNFSYAQKALQYGVIDYLLKPVDTAALLEVVSRAISHRKNIGIELSYPNNLTTIEKINIFSAIFHKGGAEPANYCECIAASCDVGRILPDMEKIAEIIQDTASKLDLNVIYSRNAMEFIMVFNHADSKEKISLFIAQITGRIGKITGETLSWGIGGKTREGYSLNHSYKDSRVAGRTAEFYRIQQVFYSDYKSEFAGDDRMNKKEILELVADGSEESLQRIQDILGSYIQQAARERIFFDAVCDRLNSLITYIQMKNQEEYNIVIKQNNSLTIMMERLDPYDRLCALTVEKVKEIAQAIKKIKTDYKSKVIEEIKEYITRNLDKQLCLSDISNHVNISESYISSYFKHAMGLPLSEYIQDMKMEKAKKLLSTKNYKINCISKMIGIDDPKYFCQLFKKYTGITASDYRKHNSLIQKQES